MTNVTLFANRGRAPDFAGVTVWGGTLTLRNGIVWGNAPRDGLVTFMGGVIDADHNDIDSGIFNDLGGNISSHPLLDADDIHLTSTSPCTDTGTCTGAPATDFDGDARPSGGGCDMGADEFVP